MLASCERCLSAEKVKKEEGERAGGWERRSEQSLTAFCVMRLQHYLLVNAV